MKSRTLNIALLSIVVVNIAVFYLVLKINLPAQFLFAVFVGVITFSGAFLLVRIKDKFPDIVFFYISSFLLGAFLTYLAGFLLFHKPVLSLLHIQSLEDTWIFVFLLLLPPAIAGYLKTRKTKESHSYSKGVLLFTLLLSSAVSFLTYSGFQPAPFQISKENFEEKILKNVSDLAQKKLIMAFYDYDPQKKAFILKDEIVERNKEKRTEWKKLTRGINRTKFKYSWGMVGDKFIHVPVLSRELVRLQFPRSLDNHKIFTFRGVQVFLITVAGFIHQFSDDVYILDGIVDVFKMAALVFWFSLLYLFFIFSTYFLNLSKKAAFLAMVSVIVYAPIFVPFFLTLSEQSFRGFFISTSNVFKNVPQLFCLTVGLAGLLLVFLSYKKKAPSFFWGCLLISASFFFKPVVFTIAAPAIFFMSIFDRERFSRDKLFGYLVLVLVPIFYKLYPVVFHLTHIKGFGFHFVPFETMIIKTQRSLPGFILENRALHVLSVYLIAFGALIPAVLYSIPVQLGKMREFGIKYYLYSRKMYLGILLPFVIGILGYSLLIQPGQKGAGNFGWISGAGIILFFPVYVKLIGDIKIKALRYFARSLYLLHLLNGTIYLFWFFL